MEETTVAGWKAQVQIDCVERIMALPTSKVKYFLCIAQFFSTDLLSKIVAHTEIINVQWLISIRGHRFHNRQRALLVFKRLPPSLMLRCSIFRIP